MDLLFEVHLLNEDGKAKAKEIAEAFDDCLTRIAVAMGGDAANGRCFSIVKTKLEEACFFAKKAMAIRPENQA